MASIEKKVSSAAILAKVYRTLKPGNSDWIAGAIEDLGWAMQGIGYHVGFEQKATPDKEPIIVTGHRAKLPCDCERPLYVEQYVDDVPTVNLLDAEGKNITPIETSEACRRTVKLYKGADVTLKSMATDGVGRTTMVQPITNYYDFNGNWIVTGFEECEIKLHYIGFPLDKDGLPMVVDEFNYKTACFYYIIGNMILGKNVGELTHSNCMALYEKFAAIAANEAKMPSTDDMDALVNIMHRVAGATGFNDSFGINFEQRSYIDF